MPREFVHTWPKPGSRCGTTRVIIRLAGARGIARQAGRRVHGGGELHAAVALFQASLPGFIPALTTPHWPQIVCHACLSSVCDTGSGLGVLGHEFVPGVVGLEDLLASRPLLERLAILLRHGEFGRSHRPAAPPRALARRPLSPPLPSSPPRSASSAACPGIRRTGPQGQHAAVLLQRHSGGFAAVLLLHGAQFGRRLDEVSAVNRASALKRAVSLLAAATP